MIRRLCCAALAGAVLAGVVAGCTDSPEVEKGLDQVIISDPTLLVHEVGDDNGRSLLRRADLEPGPRHDEFTSSSIRQTVTRLFKQGDGDDLYVLHQIMLPATLVVALQAGGGVSWYENIPNGFAMGELDDVLDEGIVDSGYDPPAQLDPTDIERVLNAGIGPLLARSVGLEPATVNWSPVMTVLTNPLPLDAVRADPDANPDDEEYDATILATLDAAGYLGAPDPSNPAFSATPVVDPATGQPVVSPNNGEPVLVYDWRGDLYFYPTYRHDNRNP